MEIDAQLLLEASIRYQHREHQRKANLQKLSDTNVLSVDTPERVKKRLDRVAQNPLARMMIAEHQKMIPDRADPLSRSEFEQLVQERVLGLNDLMPVSYLEYGLRVSQSVGRVNIRSTNRRITGYGTGSMISPRLMITNNHVLQNTSQSQYSQIEFNYQSDPNGEMHSSQIFDLDPDTFFLTNPKLDYTVVAVKNKQDSQASLSSFGWTRLIEEEGKVVIGEYVNIIQHPSGEPKQLALRENQVVDLLDDFLHYLTDTAPGSSGAPVFNDQWELLGIHHSGVPDKDSEGNILTIDGKIWRSGMGESRVKWLANEGVRISRIIQHIKKQSLSIDQKQLRDQLFDRLPDSPPVVPVTPETQTMSNQEFLNPSHSVTWNIPLQVTVNLGQISLSTPVNASAVTTPNKKAEDFQQFKDDNPDLQKELQLLERVRRGEIPYYDSASDRQSRDDYYGELIDNASSLSSKKLFNTLKELLSRTHTNQLSYKPSATLYPWVDLQPNFKIRSIYSQLEFEPEEIIQADFLIEQQKNARLKELMQIESFQDVSKFQEELDLLEAQMPYNCEHVVPQSWFDKREPMRGDLHHLFACEVICNSFRGNTPYFDFTDFGETIQSNCGKSERNEMKFEPNNGKGEGARATLYFLMRYPGKINNTVKEYQSDDLETLLEWHNAFPVTEHEKHRNMAIFKKQGNRNPLIDFPEWASKIDFSLGLG